MYCAKKYKQILLIKKKNETKKTSLSSAPTIMIWEVKFPPQSSVSVMWNRNYEPGTLESLKGHL